MNLTNEQWGLADLQSDMLVVWNLLPENTQRKVCRVRSPVKEERWIIVVPDPQDERSDFVLGTGFSATGALIALDYLKFGAS